MTTTDSPIVVRGLDHVVIRVLDLDRALGFYRGVLGCPVEKRQDSIGLVQLRAGNAVIDLVPIDGKLGAMGGAPPGEEGRNIDHFCLQLESFDEDRLRRYLEAHNVEAGEVGLRYGAEGDGPSMYVKDPDGNTVELKGPPAGS